MLTVFLARRLQHPSHPSYKATGGYLREEAVLILRRFYITENTNGSFISLNSYDVLIVPLPHSTSAQIQGKPCVEKGRTPNTDYILRQTTVEASEAFEIHPFLLLEHLLATVSYQSEALSVKVKTINP